MAPTPFHDLYGMTITSELPSSKSVLASPRTLDTRVHGLPLARHPRLHYRLSLSSISNMPLSSWADFYTPDSSLLVTRDGSEGSNSVAYPFEEAPPPASLTRTPIVLAAIAMSLVTAIIGLRLVFCGRKRTALRRLVLNPKQAEHKLRWAMIKPTGLRKEKERAEDKTAENALERLRSLLSQISQSSLDELLDEQCPRRPQPAVLHRELFVRRHSLPIELSKCPSDPPVPSGLHISSIPPTRDLYTIVEDESELERDGVKADTPDSMIDVHSPGTPSMDSASESSSEPGFTRTLLEVSLVSLASLKSILPDDDKIATSASFSLSASGCSPDSRPRTDSDASEESGSRRPYSGYSSTTSIEISDSDRCLIRRAQSLCMNYKRGTTITISEEKQTSTSGIDVLPSIITTSSTDFGELAYVHDSPVLSATSSGESVDLDDFPRPPSLGDVHSKLNVTLTASIRRSLAGESLSWYRAQSMEDQPVSAGAKSAGDEAFEIQRPTASAAELS